MNAFDSTITKTVHTVQTNSGNSRFSVRYEPFQIVDAIVYEYTAVENNINVIYREIYFYIRCTMLSVEQEQALSPAIPGHNFAVLGQAGLGKTHIVKTFGERLKRAGKRVAFTCTTGIACCNYEVSYFYVSRENDIPMPYL